MRNGLRTAGIVAVVVAAAFAYVHLAENKGYALQAGSEAPGFRLPSLAGGEVDLASQRGKVVVLNFWATWCPPCVAEMPSLERLHRALSPEGVSVVTVSTDEDEAELRRFVAERSLTLPVLKDPGGRLAAGAVPHDGLPGDVRPGPQRPRAAARRGTGRVGLGREAGLLPRGARGRPGALRARVSPGRPRAPGPP